ncbi:MAG: DUF4233 domain-containing protein [Rhodoglobus sp.]
MSSKDGATVGRVRRIRSTTESLLGIVLGLEAVLMFFVTLTVFGLRSVPAVAALVGGGLLILVLLVAAGLLRYRGGVWFGWLLQGMLVATGIVIPVMFAVALVFVGIWIYCFVRGRQIDRQRALIVSSQI